MVSFACPKSALMVFPITRKIPPIIATAPARSIRDVTAEGVVGTDNNEVGAGAGTGVATISLSTKSSSNLRTPSSRRPACVTTARLRNRDLESCGSTGRVCNLDVQESLANSNRSVNTVRRRSTSHSTRLSRWASRLALSNCVRAYKRHEVRRKSRERNLPSSGV